MFILIYYLMINYYVFGLIEQIGEMFYVWYECYWIWCEFLNWMVCDFYDVGLFWFDVVFEVEKFFWWV